VNVHVARDDYTYQMRGMQYTRRMCIRAQEIYISIYTPYLLSRWTAVAVKRFEAEMTIK